MNNPTFTSLRVAAAIAKIPAPATTTGSENAMLPFILNGAAPMHVKSQCMCGNRREIEWLIIPNFLEIHK